MARKRTLRPEEREIWRKVAKSVTPLSEDRAQELEDDPPDTPPEDAESEPATPRARPAPRLKAAPKPAEPVDRAGERRHRRGKLEIEARIDLHGLTQESARNALRGFLKTSHAYGLRTVLVITGKGLKTHDRDAQPWEFREEPGVLRRRLPEWLAEPELRSIVSGYSRAHVRHGGEGAWYVTLRRR